MVSGCVSGWGLNLVATFHYIAILCLLQEALKACQSTWRRGERPEYFLWKNFSEESFVFVCEECRIIKCVRVQDTHTACYRWIIQYIPTFTLYILSLHLTSICLWLLFLLLLISNMCMHYTESVLFCMQSMLRCKYNVCHQNTMRE